MRTRGLYIAVSLLLLVNALVLGGAGYNRSGEPDAVMILTERELPVAYRYRQENSGMSLSLQTFHTFYDGLGSFTYDPFAWLDRKKLETLGFEFPTLPSNERSYGSYDKHLPRRAYAVLEYDGSSWETWKGKLTDELAKVGQAEKEGKETPQRLSASRKNIDRSLKTGSHLFIVDAGLDPADLRRRYPDRRHYLILPAKVRVAWYPGSPVGGATGENIHGYVEVLTSEINVPHRLHAGLMEQRKPGPRYGTSMSMADAEARYQVVLHTGKRYEPWIEDIVPVQ